MIQSYLHRPFYCISLALWWIFPLSFFICISFFYSGYLIRCMLKYIFPNKTVKCIHLLSNLNPDMNRKETLILVLRSVIIHLRAWKVPPRIRSRRGCEMDKRYWWHMDSEWSITDPFQIIDNRVSFKWIIQGSQMDIRLCMNGMISFVRWMLQPTG